MAYAAQFEAPATTMLAMSDAVSATWDWQGGNGAGVQIGGGAAVRFWASASDMTASGGSPTLQLSMQVSPDGKNWIEATDAQFAAIGTTDVVLSSGFKTGVTFAGKALRYIRITGVLGGTGAYTAGSLRWGIH